MCTRPFKYWRSNKLDEYGKYGGFITGYTTNVVTYEDFKKRDIEAYPHTLLKDTFEHKDSVEVPCGRCLECKADKGRIWTFRLLAEAEYHKYAYFITLTYDNEHLIFDVPTGKKHAQLFIKNFRRVFGECRYFIVGEYGDLSNRFHLHAIVFTDVFISDLTKLTNSTKNVFFTSSKVLSCWNNKGNVQIAYGNGKAFAYTCGYIQKKFKKQGFTLMSKRPGIGYQYFEDRINQDKFYLGNGFGKSLRISLPKFLKDKYGVATFVPEDIKNAQLANKLFAANFDFSVDGLEQYRDFIESIEAQPLAVKV